MALRLIAIDRQVLLDDELHALIYTLNRDWSAIWSRHSMGSNSIPISMGTWLALRGPGWSEWTLRLPSLAHALAALLVLPVLAARLRSRRVGFLLAGLLALSPLATFYARNARPFSAVLFWGSLAILSLVLRVHDRRAAWSLAWAISAFLAVYHHLWAAPAVVAPFAILVLAAWRIPRDPGLPPWRELALAGALAATLVAAFLLPAALANPWWTVHLGKDRVNLASFQGLLELVTGSPLLGLQGLFTLFLALGFVCWWRSARAEALLVASSFLGYLAALLWVTQDDIHAPIQVARYGIALLPLALLLAAIGLDALVARLSPVHGRHVALPLIVVLWITAVAATGPFPLLLSRPNNFTNHSAFQYDYAPLPPGEVRERVFYPGLALSADSVPAVYRRLASRPDIPGVLVYPMYCGDHFNLAYAWQQAVAKPFAVGYRDDWTFPPMPHRDAWIYANMPLDYVMSRVPPHQRSKVHFQAMIPLGDTERLRREFAGWALVVHTANPLREFWPAQFPDELPEYPPAVELAARLRDTDRFPVIDRSERAQVFLIRPR